MKLRFHASTFVLLACVAAMPAFAQEAAPAPAPAEKSAKVDPDKPECRYQEVTGTHFKQKVCHTHEQWQQMQANAQQSVRERDAKATTSLGQ